MSAETPAPTTPAAPAAAPSAPEPERSYEQVYEDIQRAKTAVPRETAPVPAPTAAEKRVAKYKLDHEEKELDWDETWKDEKKRADHINAYQRGLNADREVARERQAAEQAAADRARSNWNKWLDSQGQRVVEDPSSPTGWKLVAKQATTPAAAADPLTTEEQSLRAKIKDADIVDPEDILRINEIVAERKAKAEFAAWRNEQKAAADKVTAADRAQTSARNATADAYAKIDGVIGARTKSFEALTAAEKSAVRDQAYAVANHAASGGASYDDALKAAVASVFRQADMLDAAEKRVRAALTAPVHAAASAPVVGASPAGGSSPTDNTEKSYEEVYDSIRPGWRNGRRL